MQKKIALPPLNAGFDTTMVLQWLVSVGDRVEAEQPILEIETQKSVSEVPSPEAGYVRQLFVEPNDNIGKGALLCILTDDPTESLDQDPRQGDRTGVEETAGPVPETIATAATENTVNEMAVKALPAVRKLARDLDVDLSKLRGTGPGGQITADDVRRFADSSGTSEQTTSNPSGGDGWTALPATRVALNRQMQQSLSEIPQIHISRRMNVSALSIKTEGITFTHRLVRKIGEALVEHPALRTVIDGERVREEPIGVAVAIESANGLVAPVIRGANSLELAEIAATLNDFRTRAESGSLTRTDLANGPFALTNLGMYGVDFFSAFVFHGQSAVLAVGRAVDEGAEKMAWFNLAVDHRVVDGAEAARFLATLQELINREAS